jgi:hypothetical protein
MGSPEPIPAVSGCFCFYFWNLSNISTTSL